MFAKKRPPKKGPARVGGRQVRAQQRGGEGRAAFRVQSVPWVTPRWRLLSWRAGSGGWMIPYPAQQFMAKPLEAKGRWRFLHR